MNPIKGYPTAVILEAEQGERLIVAGANVVGRFNFVLDKGDYFCFDDFLYRTVGVDLDRDTITARPVDLAMLSVNQDTIDRGEPCPNCHATWQREARPGLLNNGDDCGPGGYLQHVDGCQHVADRDAEYEFVSCLELRDR